MLNNTISKLTKRGALYAMEHRAHIKNIQWKAGDGHHPVTEVDMAVGDMFQKRLHTEREAGLIVLVEEEHLVPGETPHWAFARVAEGLALVLVDPVDGTKGYMDYNGNNADFGTMCSVVEGDKVVYSRVVMPENGTDLIVCKGRARLMVDGMEEYIYSAGDGRRVARLAQLDARLLPVAKAMGLTTQIWHSGAGMATALAQGLASFVTFPKAASLWDIAPAMALWKYGYVAYFAGKPEQTLTMNADVCDENDAKNVWSLKDTVIVSSEALRQEYIAACA